MRICGLCGREMEEEVLGDDVELGGMIKLRYSEEECRGDEGGPDSHCVFAQSPVSVGTGISVIT